jgi:hypothetical protein
MVQINLGTPETPFDAPIALLCCCSPFFDRLFKDRYLKPTPGPVRFADDDPDAFAEFLCWAYGEEIFKDKPSPRFIRLLAFSSVYPSISPLGSCR